MSFVIYWPTNEPLTWDQSDRNERCYFYDHCASVDKCPNWIPEKGQACEPCRIAHNKRREPGNIHGYVKCFRNGYTYWCPETYVPSPQFGPQDPEHVKPGPNQYYSGYLER